MQIELKCRCSRTASKPCAPQRNLNSAATVTGMATVKRAAVGKSLYPASSLVPFIFYLAFLPWAPALSAQNVPISIESKPDHKAVLPALTADNLEKMRGEVLVKIDSLKIAMRAVGDSPDNQWLTDAYAMEVEQLRYLELIYAQHQALLLDGQGMASEDEAIETELKRYREQQMATGHLFQKALGLYQRVFF